MKTNQKRAHHFDTVRATDNNMEMNLVQLKEAPTKEILLKKICYLKFYDWVNALQTVSVTLDSVTLGLSVLTLIFFLFSILFK